MSETKEKPTNQDQFDVEMSTDQDLPDTDPPGDVPMLFRANTFDGSSAPEASPLPLVRSNTLDGSSAPSTSSLLVDGTTRRPATLEETVLAIRNTWTVNNPPQGPIRKRRSKGTFNKTIQKGLTVVIPKPGELAIRRGSNNSNPNTAKADNNSDPNTAKTDNNSDPNTARTDGDSSTQEETKTAKRAGPEEIKRTATPPPTSTPKRREDLDTKSRTEKERERDKNADRKRDDPDNKPQDSTSLYRKDTPDKAPAKVTEEQKEPVPKDDVPMDVTPPDDKKMPFKDFDDPPPQYSPNNPPPNYSPPSRDKFTVTGLTYSYVNEHFYRKNVFSANKWISTLLHTSNDAGAEFYDPVKDLGLALREFEIVTATRTHDLQGMAHRKHIDTLLNKHGYPLLETAITNTKGKVVQHYGSMGFYGVAGEHIRKLLNLVEKFMQFGVNLKSGSNRDEATVKLLTHIENAAKVTLVKGCHPLAFQLCMTELGSNWLVRALEFIYPRDGALYEMLPHRFV